MAAHRRPVTAGKSTIASRNTIVQADNGAPNGSPAAKKLKLNNSKQAPASTSTSPSTNATIEGEPTQKRKVQVAAQQSSQDKPIESAIQKVLTTYELIEQILLQLHNLNLNNAIESASILKTILLSQRVNRAFHHVIQRSSQLQEILFFAPASSQRLLASPCRFNPLLYWPNNSESPLTANKIRLAYKHASPTKKSDFAPPNAGFMDYAAPMSFSEHYLPTTDNVVTAAPPPIVEESWRKMLVFQTVQSRIVKAAFWLNDDFALVDVEKLGRVHVLVEQDCTMGRLCEELLGKEVEALGERGGLMGTREMMGCE